MAIVGVGHTDFAALYADRETQWDAYDLAATSLRNALSDAGLAKDDLDGLLTARVEYERLADVIGLRRPRIVNSLVGSGRMSGVALLEAAALVATGQADTVACVYGNNGRSVKMKYGGEGGGPTIGYDTMYGLTSPGAYVGLMYQRYRHLYGAPDDALAPLAMNNRRNAALNPYAVMGKEITREQYLESRYIAEPLRLYDYCIINDGGVALIVTTVERARDLAKPVVRVAASAVTGDLTNFYSSDDFFYTSCRNVAREVYGQAGVTPEDIKCLEVYDNFTPTILFSLEGFGHAPRGEAWQWVREHGIGYDGDRPLNTSGGHTAESYMQGWALLVESVRQVRGEAEARQVAGCDVLQYVCASPIVSSHILTTE
ncbi:thiolase family protein [Pseudonocardia lutea]|uniref:Thiolase family protein n=1 Tax=Pseudonocardia lutea TaxID=2172015 RepID=A0ABW1IFQ6_9PSEU